MVVAIAILANGCALSRSHQSPGNINLHRVKRVFIGVTPDEISKRLQGFLAEALASRGFVAADSPGDSDATITIEKSEWITVDGPQPDPPRYGFKCEVLSPALNINWRTAIEVASRAEVQEIERRGVERVAEKLFRAWKDSAVRAGDLPAAQAKALRRIPREEFR